MACRPTYTPISSCHAQSATFIPLHVCRWPAQDAAYLVRETHARNYLDHLSDFATKAHLWDMCQPMLKKDRDLIFENVRHGSRLGILYQKRWLRLMPCCCRCFCRQEAQAVPSTDESLARVRPLVSASLPYLGTSPFTLHKLRTCCFGATYPHHHQIPVITGGLQPQNFGEASIQPCTPALLPRSDSGQCKSLNKLPSAAQAEVARIKSTLTSYAALCIERQEALRTSVFAASPR